VGGRTYLRPARTKPKPENGVDQPTRPDQPTRRTVVPTERTKTKQKAAWEYLKFLTSTDATVKWAMDTGYLPVRTSAYESETYQEFMAGDATATASYAQTDAFFSSPAFDGQL